MRVPCLDLCRIEFKENYHHDEMGCNLSRISADFGVLTVQDYIITPVKGRYIY